MWQICLVISIGKLDRNNDVCIYSPPRRKCIKLRQLRHYAMLNLIGSSTLYFFVFDTVKKVSKVRSRYELSNTNHQDG